MNINTSRKTLIIVAILVVTVALAFALITNVPNQTEGQAGSLTVSSSDSSTNADAEASDELAKELRLHVRKEIGPIATPDHIHLTPALPKTRSGKIMRRILRKIAENDFGSLGDTSTLADPSVVENLIEGRQNR